MDGHADPGRVSVRRLDRQRATANRRVVRGSPARQTRGRQAIGRLRCEFGRSPLVALHLHTVTDVWEPGPPARPTPDVPGARLPRAAVQRPHAVTPAVADADAVDCRNPSRGVVGCLHYVNEQVIGGMSGTYVHSCILRWFGCASLRRMAECRAGRLTCPDTPPNRARRRATNAGPGVDARRPSW